MFNVNVNVNRFTLKIIPPRLIQWLLSRVVADQTWGELFSKLTCNNVHTSQI